MSALIIAISKKSWGKIGWHSLLNLSPALPYVLKNQGLCKLAKLDVATVVSMSLAIKSRRYSEPTIAKNGVLNRA